VLREITLGQYYPVDSFIHRLDPRVKLAGTFLFLIALFIVNSWTAYAVLALVLFGFILLSKVPFSFMVRGLKSVLFLLLLSVSFNLFLTPGEELFRIFFLKMTKEGLQIASMMAIRLVMLVLSSSILTLTTTPNALTDGMEKGLGILKVFHFPVHEIAMMMSIALRFIPILVEETDKIMKAQMARGADFESGNIFKRAKAIIPLLVPLFVSAFRIARELAMAMEARCYRGGENRTRMNHSVISKIDYTAIIVFLTVSALILLQSYVLPLFFSYSIILNLG